MLSLRDMTRKVFYPFERMGQNRYVEKVFNAIAPPPSASSDGRDQWPSRTAFLLAAMGGCAGQGNLLRYPSVVYNNYGLQWFIPYLMAVFLIAIPALVLEIAIGQAYRGGTVIAFNNIHRRLKGVGLGPVFVSFIVVVSLSNLPRLSSNARSNTSQSTSHTSCTTSERRSSAHCLGKEGSTIFTTTMSWPPLRPISAL